MVTVERQRACQPRRVIYVMEKNGESYNGSYISVGLFRAWHPYKNCNKRNKSTLAKRTQDDKVPKLVDCNGKLKAIIGMLLFYEALRTFLQGLLLLAQWNGKLNAIIDMLLFYEAFGTSLQGLFLRDRRIYCG